MCREKFLTTTVVVVPVEQALLKLLGEAAAPGEATAAPEEAATAALEEAAAAALEEAAALQKNPMDASTLKPCLIGFLADTVSYRNSLYKKRHVSHLQK